MNTNPIQVMRINNQQRDVEIKNARLLKSCYPLLNHRRPKTLRSHNSPSGFSSHVSFRMKCPERRLYLHCESRQEQTNVYACADFAAS